MMVDKARNSIIYLRLFVVYGRLSILFDKEYASFISGEKYHYVDGNANAFLYKE